MSEFSKRSFKAVRIDTALKDFKDSGDIWGIQHDDGTLVIFVPPTKCASEKEAEEAFETFKNKLIP